MGMHVMAQPVVHDDAVAVDGLIVLDRDIEAQDLAEREGLPLDGLNEPNRRGRVAHDDARGSDRIGRTDEGAGGIPSTAARVEEGRGELSYRATEDGTVYLYDTDSRTHLDTQRVRKGQRYTIDPDRSIATLDGKTVWDRTMDPKHTHRLYFDPAR